MLRDSDAQLTVVYPVIEPRGRVADRVRTWNPVELAGAISRLLEAPSLRAMMGAAAAASARARLNRRTMVGALLAWCAEIHAAWAAPR